MQIFMNVAAHVYLSSKPIERYTMLELNNGAIRLELSIHGLHGGKTWVEPIALYASGAVSTLCHDDAKKNGSRMYGVVIK